jgi:thiol-disulfide isomerase/thioredoxin
MNDDLRKILPWLVIPMIVAGVAVFGSGWGDRSLVGQPAPAFDLTIQAGEGSGERDRVALASLAGHPVLLDFWASWCGPCRRSTPILNEIQERYKSSGLRAYGINVEPMLGARALVQAHRLFGARFPSLQDETGEVQRAYRVHGLPTIVIVEPSGNVSEVFVGVPRASDLDDAIAHVLRGRSRD